MPFLPVETAAQLLTESNNNGIEWTNGTEIHDLVVGEAQCIVHGSEDGLGMIKDTVHLTVIGAGLSC